MIPLYLVGHFACALLCCIGYYLTTTSHRRWGYLLGGLGSTGWLMFAPSVFFAAQSLVFLVASVIGYERAGKNTSGTHR